MLGMCYDDDSNFGLIFAVLTVANSHKTLYFSHDFVLSLVILLTVTLFFSRKELQEELGINLPKDAFELIFVFLQEW